MDVNNNQQSTVREKADAALKAGRAGHNKRQLVIWILALAIGAGLGWMGNSALNELFNFIAQVYTRLFQFIAVPTISLAVITTLAALGAQKNTGKIFGHAVTYTLLTTFAAALIAMGLYIWIAPGNLPASVIGAGASAVPQDLEQMTYYDHFLSVIPNNILAPFLSGNVLSVLIISAATGLALAFMKKTENREVLLKGIYGLQEVLFALIRALLWALPVGIMAYAAQLSSQIQAGVIIGALGKYVAVVLGGNFIQIFIIIPIFPLASAEENMKVNHSVSRFVLPICTTINMNGCAAFILTTSLFLMQNAGFHLSIGTMLVWVVIAVISAIGNAGVPMGCYFLTLSLMSSIGAPLGLMGVILPIYPIIDMIETAENVWSDSAVCAMTNHDLKDVLENDDRHVSGDAASVNA